MSSAVTVAPCGSAVTGAMACALDPETPAWRTKVVGAAKDTTELKLGLNAVLGMARKLSRLSVDRLPCASAWTFLGAASIWDRPRTRALPLTSRVAVGPPV